MLIGPGGVETEAFSGGHSAGTSGPLIGRRLGHWRHDEGFHSGPVRKFIKTFFGGKIFASSLLGHSMNKLADRTKPGQGLRF